MKPPQLPQEAQRLCRELAAPPRLVAHLLLVHESAVDLCERLAERWPNVPVDRGAVALGAAIHDLGKTAHPEELTGPGTLHEAAGERLLLERGIPAPIARFARTHGSWEGGELEDLLVALADGAWKGSRREDLEMLAAKRVAAAAGAEVWQVWSWLDGVLSAMGRGAAARLAWQRGFGPREEPPGPTSTRPQSRSGSTRNR